MIYYPVLIQQLAKNMRIAMIGQKGTPAIYGGIERHVEGLSKELTKIGHEVLVYARSWYTPKTVKQNHGVKIIHTNSLHTKHLDAITHTFTATLDAMKQKVDIIHYHGVGPALLSWLPRLFAPKIKVVATFHSLDRYQLKWGWFARLMLRLGEKAACTFPHETITISRTLHTFCLNQYQKDTAYLPNGVSIPVLKNSTNHLYEWNLESKKYFLCVARLIKDKGVHYLLNAWQLARQQFPKLLGDQKLVIVGSSITKDNKYLNKLKEIARGDKSIVFVGWQQGQKLNELYEHATMFVHPSENEGLPMVVLEAMSYGLPVLASDIPAHQEAIPDRRFWFNTANVYALAEKIVEIMEKPDLMEKAGKENRELSAKEYDWEKITKDTNILYQNLWNKQAEKKWKIA